MNKTVVVSAVIVVGIGVIGGGSYYYANQQAEQRFQEKIAFIKNTFSGSTLTFASRHISVFSKQAILDKVTFKNKEGAVYTADKVDVVLGTGDTISKLGVDKFTLKDGNSNLSIEHIDVADLDIATGAVILEDGKIKRIFPSKFSFASFDVKNLNVNDGLYSKLNIAHYLIKNYGLGKKTDTVLKDLAIKDRTTEFKLASLQVNQANQADMIKHQEEFIDDINNRQSSDLMIKKLFQNLSEIQFKLFSINDLQYSKYGVDFKLNHYELKNFGLGHTISQSLKDFSVTFSNNTSFKIASIDNNGIDLAMLAKSMQSVQFVYPFNFGQMVLQLQKAYLKDVKQLQTNSKVTGLTFTKDQNRLSLAALAISSEASWQGKTEETYKLDNFEFILSRNSYNPYLQLLKDVGYNTVSLSGALSAQYQLDTKAISFSLNNLVLKDIGTLNASLKGSVPLEDLYANSDIVLMNPELKFKEFSLSVQDTGFIEKLIEKISVEQTISTDAVKKYLIDQVDNTVKEMLSSPAHTKEIINKQKEMQDNLLVNQIHQAVETLLKNSQKTEIQLTSVPNEPINFIGIAGKNQKEILELFNLQVKAVPLK